MPKWTHNPSSPSTLATKGKLRTAGTGLKVSGSAARRQQDRTAFRDSALRTGGHSRAEGGLDRAGGGGATGEEDRQERGQGTPSLADRTRTKECALHLTQGIPRARKR